MKYIALLIVVLFFSCAKKVETDLETSFFDMEVFVDSILLVEKNREVVNRSISINEENEVKELSNVDMTDIFGFLKQFNINRPRWYDKYSVKHSENTTTYTSLEDDFDVKTMTITRRNNIITKIDVLYSSKTLISSSEKHVIWNPSSSLILDNTSKSLWSEEEKMNITWTY